MMVSDLLTVLIITYNEEVNLPHTLKNICNVTDKILILDSYSTDLTEKIAVESGAKVFKRKFDNFSSQRKYALECLPFQTEWVLILDADEILTEELKIEISKTLRDSQFDAYMIKRQFYWQGKWIKRGYYPTWLLRLGKVDKIACDNRQVNEHLVCVNGNVGKLKNDFIDYNRKGITAWISKHNEYSDFEAKELLKIDPKKYRFFAGQYERKRWIRKHIWNNLPVFFRPLLYFIFRYFFLLGFLDGRRALTYHFLHAFVYRTLIDIKYLELKWKEKKFDR